MARLRQFTRSLMLPDDIDGDNIGANVENGLPTLALNVHPKAQPKKIVVNFKFKRRKEDTGGRPCDGRLILR